MIFVLSTLLVLGFTGFAMLARAIRSAPEGFEDELGFHRLR